MFLVVFCILLLVIYIYAVAVGEERANLPAIVYLYLCGFCTERLSLPLGAWDGLPYFIVALLGPSI